MWEQVCCEPHSPVQLVAESKAGGGRRSASVHERPGSETETLLDFARATGDPRGPLRRGGAAAPTSTGPECPVGPEHAQQHSAELGEAGKRRKRLK